MDHCLMGVKQQPTCFPNSTPHEYINTLQKQQHIGDIWNVHASYFVNPLYEVINQDIKWITKLKWKRNLKVNNSQRTLKAVLPSDNHYSSHTLSYLLSIKNPVFSRRRSKMPRKFLLSKNENVDDHVQFYKSTNWLLWLSAKISASDKNYSYLKIGQYLFLNYVIMNIETTTLACKFHCSCATKTL